MSSGDLKLAIVTSHPVQYQAPWFRALAQRCNLHVYFTHRQTAAQQAEAGYGVEFDWDVDVLGGYRSTFLRNMSSTPSVYAFAGSDTPEIEHVLSRNRPSVVIVCGWYLKSYWQAVRACRRLGIPVLVRGDSQLRTPRSLPRRLAKEIVYRWLLRQFDAHLCVGTRNREYLQHYGCPEDRIFSVPHFVDNDFFAKRGALDAEARTRLRAELGLSESDVALLFVGRFVSFKRPVDLVRAAARLRRSGVPVTPVFVGSGALEADIRETGAREQIAVRILGFRNQAELPRVYKACDLLVLPSNGQETWGLVVNEAMASGLPVVVSDSVGCAPDLVKSGKTGMVARASDPTSLAEAIEQALPLRNTPELAAALRQILDVHSCEVATRATLQAAELVVRQRCGHA